MQTSGVFAALNQGLRTKRSPQASASKPASTLPRAIKGVQKLQQQSSELPPKRRRQLNAQPSGPGTNPFANLQQLAQKALKP